MRRVLLALAVAVAVFAGGFGISRLTASHAAAPRKPSPSLATQIGQSVAKAMQQQTSQSCDATDSCGVMP